MNRPENLAVAVAWYRQEQWALLRAVSAGGDELEVTYAEWLAFATRHVCGLEARGIQVQKVIDRFAFNAAREKENRFFSGGILD